MRPAVQAILDGIAEEVAGLDPVALRAIAPILVEAEREVQRDLAKWLATVKGADRFTAYELRRVLAQLREALEKIRQVDPALYAALRRTSNVAGALATRHVTDSLSQLSTIYGSSLSPVALNTAAIIAKGDRMLIPRHVSSAERYAGLVGRDIRHQLALGMVRGETIDQMTVRLMRLGGPKGLVYVRGAARDPGAISEFISEGLFTRYRSWAERVARTETLNAYNVQADIGIKAAEDAAGVGLQRAWNAALDRRVCLDCRDMDGRTAPIGQPFPGGCMAPPLHPNCRCSVVAWHPDWRD
jgi:SPP1 gp7 family putative phage head morphogenesis protein